MLQMDQHVQRSSAQLRFKSIKCKQISSAIYINATNSNQIFAQVFASLPFTLTKFKFRTKSFIYIYILLLLQELEKFIINSTEVLSLVFDWDDSNSLLRILNVLNQIKEYEPSIKNLFPSLKKIIYMLMQYDIKIPKRCLNQVKCTHTFNVYSCHHNILTTKFERDRDSVQWHVIEKILCGVSYDVSVFRLARKVGRFMEDRINHKIRNRSNSSTSNWFDQQTHHIF